jgi:putative membrane protein
VEVAFSHWSVSWPVLAAYALVAVAHLAGLSRLLSGGGAGRAGVDRPELRREALLFHLGLLLIVLAVISPVGYWSGVYLWVRAMQALLLAVVGPGLVVVGAPWASFGELLPGRVSAAARGQLGRVPVVRSPVLKPTVRLSPVLKPTVRMSTALVVAFNVVFVCWQLPVLADPAVTSAPVRLAEHACYLAFGLLLWLQLIASRPLVPAAAPLRRMAMVIGTVVVSTVLGMVLVFGSGVLYSGYANSAHDIMSVLDDQQLSGAVLWMGMLPPMIVVAVALLMHWFDNEESQELSAELDRLLIPRRHGWPSRPIIR